MRTNSLKGQIRSPTFQCVMTYSGCLLNESRGPSCFGFCGFGSQLALVTALGSKGLSGKRELLTCSAAYMYGWCEVISAASIL